MTFSPFSCAAQQVPPQVAQVAGLDGAKLTSQGENWTLVYQYEEKDESRSFMRAAGCGGVHLNSQTYVYFYILSRNVIFMH